MHCNGSRPNQDHIKRQHSVNKRKKRLLGKPIVSNAYDVINIKYHVKDVLSYWNYAALQYIYNIFLEHQSNSDESVDGTQSNQLGDILWFLFNQTFPDI